MPVKKSSSWFACVLNNQSRTRTHACVVVSRVRPSQGFVDIFYTCVECGVQTKSEFFIRFLNLFLQDKSIISSTNMSELTPASIKKLKVAELRSELSKLGLDTKGTKPVLVERLLQATTGKNEENDAVEGGTEGENDTDSKEESSQESQDESAGSAKQDEPVVSAEPSEVVSDAKVEDEKVVEEKPNSEAVPPEKMETNDESAAAEPPKETPKEEPASKSEDVVKETPKDEDKKKVEKEEPMDETPGGSTPSKQAGNKNVIMKFPSLAEIS